MNEAFEPYNQVPPEHKQQPSWLTKHKTALIRWFNTASSAALIYSNDIIDTVDAVRRHSELGYILAGTELLAWGGELTMIASAGRKIGNPLTVRKRLDEIKYDLQDSKTFRAAWLVGATGAIGTAGTVMAGAVAHLPETSWPLAATASATSIVLSTIPFKPAKNPLSEGTT